MTGLNFVLTNWDYHNTLKDLKNAKTEIHKIYLFLVYQFYWKLTTIIINMSAKYDQILYQNNE